MWLLTMRKIEAVILLFIVAVPLTAWVISFMIIASLTK